MLKKVLSSQDDTQHPVCVSNKKNSNVFTYASVVMTLSKEPNLQVTAGPPNESKYIRIGFSKK